MKWIMLSESSTSRNLALPWEGQVDEQLEPDVSAVSDGHTNALGSLKGSHAPHDPGKSQQSHQLGCELDLKGFHLLGGKGSTQKK